MTLHRVTEHLSGRPLFMHPPAAKALIDAVGSRLGLSTPEQPTAAQATADRRAALSGRMAAIVEADLVDVGDGMGEYVRTANGIAVVSVAGTLTNRYGWLNALCGFSSYDGTALTMRTAASDPQVKAILLDCHSPGGEAPGMLDCSDGIHAIGKEKPVWASANTLAASAAFGLAAAAERLTLGRLATVGSVGVVGIHIDQSGNDAERGLKFTAIYSGAHKIDGWGHAPLGEDARKRIQGQFDEARRKFAEAVGRYRGMSTEAVLRTEAMTYDDDAAVRVGFANAVMTFEDTLAELGEKAMMGPRSFSIGAKSDGDRNPRAADNHGWGEAIERASRRDEVPPVQVIGHGWDAAIVRAGRKIT